MAAQASVSPRTLKVQVRKLRRALATQVHDDEAAGRAWDALKDEDARERAFKRLNGMLARSTGSINNSYLKVQITSGIVVGLIALFLTVFAPRPNINNTMLVIGVVMEAVGIGLSFLITTPRSSNWTQIVETPGVFAAKQTRRQEYVSLSRRVHYNRVVLLGSRRLSWLITWVLTLPGLTIVMLAWAWLATLVALVAVVLLVVLYRRFIGSGRPAGSGEYPSP